MSTPTLADILGQIERAETADEIESAVEWAMQQSGMIISSASYQEAIVFLTELGADSDAEIMQILRAADDRLMAIETCSDDPFGDAEFSGFPAVWDE